VTTIDALLILLAIGFMIGTALMAVLRYRRARAASLRTDDGMPDRKRGFHLYRLIDKVRDETRPVPQFVPYKSKPTPEHEKSKWQRPVE
jgi:hypothetical protein